MNKTPTLLRMASQGLLAAALAAVMAALFLALVAVQLTGADTGQRLLRRAVAVTTEIDATLPRIQGSLRQAAEATAAQEVRVPNFPIPVDLPRTEALAMEQEELRARLLDESARRLYRDGMSAWAEADPEADQEIEAISAAGALERGLGLITDDSHRAVVIAASVLGFLATALALLLLSILRPHARLIALGAATVAAALPSLAAAIAVRFILRTAEDDSDPFVSGMLDLGVDAVWVAIRDYLALSALGFGVVAMGAFFLQWQGQRKVSEPPPTPGLTP